MLVMPTGSSNVIAIVGIDPGSFNMGVAVILFNIETLEIVSTQAWTLSGVKLGREERWTTELHGELEGRIAGMGNTLLEILRHFQPLLVASEAPFISKKFPQAGLVLTRVVSAIRLAVMQYDVWKSLDIIDPPSVKNAVGAAGNAPKEVMKEKVLQLPINYIGKTPLQELDEHSIDAIAVAYGRLMKWLGDLCLR